MGNNFKQWNLTVDFPIEQTLAPVSGISAEILSDESLMEEVLLNLARSGGVSGCMSPWTLKAVTLFAFFLPFFFFFSLSSELEDASSVSDSDCELPDVAASLSELVLLTFLFAFFSFFFDFAEDLSLFLDVALSLEISLFGLVQDFLECPYSPQFQHGEPHSEVLWLETLQLSQNFFLSVHDCLTFVFALLYVSEYSHCFP